VQGYVGPTVGRKPWGLAGGYYAEILTPEDWRCIKVRIAPQDRRDKRVRVTLTVRDASRKRRRECARSEGDGARARRAGVGVANSEAARSEAAGSVP
jgi:hypothetical protein